MLRVLCKLLPASVELATAVALDEQAEAGIPQDLPIAPAVDADFSEESRETDGGQKPEGAETPAPVMPDEKLLVLEAAAGDRAVELGLDTDAGALVLSVALAKYRFKSLQDVTAEKYDLVMSAILNAKKPSG